MSDVVSIFQGLVNTNLQEKTSDYKLPILDTCVRRDKPYLLDISGDSESLKTRLSLYMANSIMSNNTPVYWVSASDYNPFLTSLEIKFPERMMLILDNDLYRVINILRELPDNSDVFIDSIISVYSEVEGVMEKPYLTFGKALHRVSQQKALRIHTISPISGMYHRPVSDSFDRLIQYKMQIRKVQSYRDFVGLNYQMVGGYYKVTLGDSSQLVHAGLATAIDVNETLFFWLVSSGKIEKRKRTYYYRDKNLGASFRKICKDTELLNEVYNQN